MNNNLSYILEKGQILLNQNKFEKARFEAYLIAGKVLQKNLLDILVNKDMKISQKKSKLILQKIYKRILGKPISKIFGFKEFYSNEFFVNSFVLDPRPESELIVDIILKKVKKDGSEKLKLLELGLGSACLIISIVNQLSNKKIEALGVDISEKALEIAKKNIEKFSLNKKISIKKSNWFSNIKGKFDIIVSNPPYIKKSMIKNLDLDVRLYDPVISLDGGQSGLQAFHCIARGVSKHLKKNGIICLEIGFGQFRSVNKIFEENGFKCVLKEKDLQGIVRVVVYKYKNLKVR